MTGAYNVRASQFKRGWVARLELSHANGVEVLHRSTEARSERAALEDLAESTANRLATNGPQGWIDPSRIPEPMRSKVCEHLARLQQFHAERVGRIGEVLAFVGAAELAEVSP